MPADDEPSFLDEQIARAAHPVDDEPESSPERESPKAIYVSLTFRLAEQVTPELFAQRVAEACFTRNALRPEEAVVVPDGSGREYRDGGPVDVSALLPGGGRDGS